MKSYKNYNTILCNQEGQVFKITLNRPEVHNAFNGEMIKELFEIFSLLVNDNEIRCIILTGSGKSFCAGADLNWMKDVINFTYQQNLDESILLAKLFYLIYTHPKVVIGKINGTAIGGGVGFVSVCDIAVAYEEAKFGLSEVKIGLIPACISPYVVKRMGEIKAKEYFITGERIDTNLAIKLNLVDYVLKNEEVDSFIDSKIKLILSSGPNAVLKVKELMTSITQMHYHELLTYTAGMIAELRMSPEAQEGMKAFLEKRKPDWIKNEL